MKAIALLLEDFQCRAAFKDLNGKKAAIPRSSSKNFVNFTWKHLCWSLLLIKLQACNFIKVRLQHRCLPVDIAKFLKAAFWQSLRWLLLKGSIFIRLRRKSWYTLKFQFCWQIPKKMRLLIYICLEGCSAIFNLKSAKRNHSFMSLHLANFDK